jgi:flagellar basal body-associated protein FliL
VEVEEMANESFDLDESLISEDGPKKSAGFKGKLKDLKNLKNLKNLKIDNLKQAGTLGKIIGIIVILVALIIIIWVAIEIGGLIGGSASASEEGPHNAYANFDISPIQFTVGNNTNNQYFVKVKMILAYDISNYDLQIAITRNMAIVNNIITTILSTADPNEVLNTELRENSLKLRIKDTLNQFLVKCDEEDFEKYCADKDERYREILETHGQYTEDLKCNCKGIATIGVKDIYFQEFIFYPMNRQ